MGEKAGKAPGVAIFSQETGIAQHEWLGVFWPRWSDALAEAGFEPNELRGRYDSYSVLVKVAEASLKLGHVPTAPEMKMLRRTDEDFPNPKTVSAHFGSKAKLLETLRTLSVDNSVYAKIAEIIPEFVIEEAEVSIISKVDGWVYLLKSGNNYKVGRSDTLERRVKEISVALPEAVSLVHAIRADDPTGIENYWHRRFAGLRLNGEWFRLGASELAAFKRRKFQ